MSAGPWSRWVRFLDRREDGLALALFRVAVGLTVLGTLLSVVAAGAFDTIWMDADHGGYRDFSRPSWAWRAMGGWSPDRVRAVYAVAVAAAFATTVGVGGRVLGRLVPFVALHGYLALADLNGHAGGAYDELLANSLWLLVLAGPTRTLSLEAWRRTGRLLPRGEVHGVVRDLIVYQAILMYTMTGWQKLSVHWVPGGDLAALYYILLQPTWQVRDMTWVAWVFPMTQLATAVTWLWEVTAPLWGLAYLASLPGVRWGGWLRRGRVREAYGIVGLVFHLLILGTMNVGPFSWASMALYLVFIHPEEWRAAVATLRRAPPAAPPPGSPAPGSARR